MQNKDIRTLGYVLRRTNYGEADRILNLITPAGKISVMAKGVRREKSKLAGGVEMFTLSEYNVHFGKGDFGTLTGAKMVQHYGEIMKDLARIELASLILKKVSMAADSSDSAEFFEIVDQSLKSINKNVDLRKVEIWYLLNLVKVMGEEVNLYRDMNGERLLSEQRYDWNGREAVFMMNENGRYGADEIKLMRLTTTVKLDVIERVKTDDLVITNVLDLARIASGIQKF